MSEQTQTPRERVEETPHSNLAVISAPIDRIAVRSGEAVGDGRYAIEGHAAVFDLLSHDLGGFREKVAPKAFEDVLLTDPDVHFDWDHDTRYVLARTRNKSLELSEDQRGLRIYAKVAPTSYAADLAVLLEGGFIDQMSFKFTIESEEWTEDEDGNLTSTILRVGDLYDVTVTAQGAYPQTDAQLVRQRFERAVTDGRVPDLARAKPIVADLGPGETATPIAASEPGGSASPTGAATERAKRQRELDIARATTP